MEEKCCWKCYILTSRILQSDSTQYAYLIILVGSGAYGAVATAYDIRLPE